MDPTFTSFDQQPVASSPNSLTCPNTADNQSQLPHSNQQQHDKQKQQQHSRHRSQSQSQSKHHQQSESQPQTQPQQHHQPQHLQQPQHQLQQFPHYSTPLPHQESQTQQPPPYPYPLRPQTHVFEAHPHHGVTAPQLAQHYPLHHHIHQPPYLSPSHPPTVVPSDTATAIPVHYSDPSNPHNHPLIVSPDASQFSQQHIPVALPQPYSVTQALPFVPGQHPQQPYHPTRPYAYGQLDYAIYHPPPHLQDRSQTPQLPSSYTPQHLTNPPPPQSLPTSQPITASRDVDHHHHQLHAIHSLHPLPPHPSIDVSTDPTQLSLHQQSHQQLYAQPHYPQQQFPPQQTAPSFYNQHINQLQQPSDHQLISSNQQTSYLSSTNPLPPDRSEIKQHQSSDSHQRNGQKSAKRNGVQEDDHHQNQVSRLETETRLDRNGQQSSTSSKPSPPPVSRPSASFSSPLLLPTQRPPPQQRKPRFDHSQTQSQIEKQENGKPKAEQIKMPYKNGHSKKSEREDSKLKNGVDKYQNSTRTATQAQLMDSQRNNIESLEYQPENGKSCVESSKASTDGAGSLSHPHAFCAASLVASLPSDSSRMSPCTTTKPQSKSFVHHQNGKHTTKSNGNGKTNVKLTTSFDKPNGEEYDFKNTRNVFWTRKQGKDQENQVHIKDLVDDRNSVLSIKHTSDATPSNGKVSLQRVKTNGIQSKSSKDNEDFEGKASRDVPCRNNTLSQQMTVGDMGRIPKMHNQSHESEQQQVTDSNSNTQIRQKTGFDIENSEKNCKALQLAQRDDTDVAALVLGVDLAKDRGGEVFRNGITNETGPGRGRGKGGGSQWANSKGEKKKKTGAALPVHLRNPKRGRARVFRECRACHTENHIRRSDCSKCGETLPIGKRRRDGQVTFWWREGEGVGSVKDAGISATPSASESVDATVGAGETDGVREVEGEEAVKRFGEGEEVGSVSESKSNTTEQDKIDGSMS